MIIQNTTLPDGRVRDVRISQDRIADVDEHVQAEPREGTIDATGLRIFPGAIDAHVHFREPGAAHKETWETGTASAAAGGVTTVVDQPNTDPPTVSGDAFDEKLACASDALVDFGINGGVTPDWDPSSLFERPLFALGEVFLADSTGDMGIPRDLFETAVDQAAAASVPITVHAEATEAFDHSVRDRTDPAAWSDFRPPAAELSAVETVVEVAETVDTSLHIAHASTPEAIDLAHDHDLTCEVTPHHLYFSTDDATDLGTFGRMNPPLRDEARREGVWERLVDGTVDIVATDHAPHTAAEKDASIWDAPSGVPGVESMLPLLLASAARGDLSYNRVAEVTAERPAEIFDLPKKGRIEPGYDADLVLVDPTDERPIKAEELHTACSWTPFEGWTGMFPLMTMVRGQVVYEDGRIGRPVGRNVRDH